MRIHASSVIRHPLGRVYRAYRDELPQIAAFMPNIDSIVVRSREDRTSGPKLHNVWKGKGEVPQIAQGVIRPEMVCWDDYADWADASTSCRWQIRTRVFTEKVHCGGTNRLAAEGDRATRVTLEGELELDLADIPGVPRIFARTLKPQVERFIIAMIRPNLEQVNQALERYLDQA